MPASRVEPVGAGKYDPQAGRDEETVSRADYLALLARFEKLEQQLSKQAPNAEEDLSSAPGPLKRDQSAKMGALWAGARQEAVGEIDCTGKDNIYGFCYEAVYAAPRGSRPLTPRRATTDGSPVAVAAA